METDFSQINDGVSRRKRDVFWNRLPTHVLGPEYLDKRRPLSDIILLAVLVPYCENKLTLLQCNAKFSLGMDGPVSAGIREDGFLTAEFSLHKRQREGYLIYFFKISLLTVWGGRRSLAAGIHMGRKFVFVTADKWKETLSTTNCSKFHIHSFRFNGQHGVLHGGPFARVSLRLSSQY